MEIMSNLFQYNMISEQRPGSKPLVCNLRTQSYVTVGRVQREYSVPPRVLSSGETESRVH